MRKRRVLVELDPPHFERLAEAARTNEREVHQEATYLLKRVLGQPRVPASNAPQRPDGEGRM